MACLLWLVFGFVECCHSVCVATSAVGRCRWCLQGAFVDGRREGYGKCEYADGSVYKGAWKGNRRNGVGVCKCVTDISCA